MKQDGDRSARPIVMELLVGSAVCMGCAWPAIANSKSEIMVPRTERAPVVDGELDDSAWSSAVRLPPFIQRAPHEGNPPTQRTDVQLLYTPSALFVGVRLWDTQPSRMLGGIGRRDSPPLSDSFTVYLDPLLTGQRGYYFRINLSGVHSDGLVYNHVEEDNSWDGVWDGATRVGARGWTAELRIPLTSLAFHDLPCQSWGMYFERKLQRKMESSSWPSMDKWATRLVSKFARIGQT